MNKIDELNQFLLAVVPKEDLRKLKLDLKTLGKKRGGSMKKKRGGTKKGLLTIVIIIGIVVGLLGYCEETINKATGRQILNRTLTDGIFYCWEIKTFLNYLPTWYSIYGRQQVMYALNKLLALAKNEIVQMYAAGGVGTLGAIATGANYIRGTRAPTTASVSTKDKKNFKLLKDKISKVVSGEEPLPRAAKKPWKNYTLIANPGSGRLVDATKTTGLKVLQKFSLQSKQSKKRYPYICNPDTGIWMDVRSVIGKKVIAKYLDK